MDSKGFAQNYLQQLSELVAKVDSAAIGTAIDWMRDARDRQQTVYACGNGGSALIASQMVVDIVKGASYGHPTRFKMLGLSDNMGTVTAYANDVSYDVVFVEQLKNFAQKDDVLIGISGSGNSKNVLLATEYANSIGCKTIGITTANGGRLKDIAQLPLLVPSSHMGRLEDCFFAMTHILCYAFIEAMKS
jgi:D-sedoheptulose 7-phosphate isomerase